jgi:small membrane protein
MLIQFILVAVIVLIVLRLIYQLKNKAIGLWQFFSWLVIWILAIAVIWYPSITTYIATRVGVGRGVDLVTYVSIIVIFYLMFRLLLKIEKIEKKMTKLVRKDALKNVSQNEKNK